MKLKRIFKKWDGESWTGLIWLRVGIGGRGDLVNAVMNLLDRKNAGNFSNS
jgi:hypothetical protein